MSKELVISSNRHETRVAIIEEDEVVEVYHQRENEYSLAGSIHKGRVTRVLPGMQSAFVDIGLDRDAFLYVSDFFEDNEEYDKIVTSVEEKVFKQWTGRCHRAWWLRRPRRYCRPSWKMPGAPAEVPGALPASGAAVAAPPAAPATASRATPDLAPLPDQRRTTRGRRPAARRSGPAGAPVAAAARAEGRRTRPAGFQILFAGTAGRAEGESGPRELPPEPAPRVMAPRGSSQDSRGGSGRFPGAAGRVPGQIHGRTRKRRTSGYRRAGKPNGRAGRIRRAGSRRSRPKRQSREAAGGSDCRASSRSREIAVGARRRSEMAAAVAEVAGGAGRGDLPRRNRLPRTERP